MKVVLAGGTGSIGRALAQNLNNAGYEVLILSRDPKPKKKLFPSGIKLQKWDPGRSDSLKSTLEGVEAVINLSGENLAGSSFIPKRWSMKRKEIILESRTTAGKTLTQAILDTSQPPPVFIQASAIGYYGSADNGAFTEESPPGSGFLADVCVSWERSTEEISANGVRRVVIRSAVVLNADEGALMRLILPFKLFVGGPLGSGKQWFPWIHPVDEIRAIRFLLEHENAEGPFNLIAPNPVRNAELAKTLGATLRRPSLIPVPGLALRLALGEVASMVLEGQRAIPKRLEDLGFTFQFPDFKPAIEDVLKSG
jgi:uncharacterized protein (TIGR01777 family)